MIAFRFQDTLHEIDFLTSADSCDYVIFVETIYLPILAKNK